MKMQIVATCLILGMGGTAYSAAPDIIKEKLPDEVRADQVRDMKWGMFICWSYSTFAGQEWTPTRGKDASYFKATGCDTDQWCHPASKVYQDYTGAMEHGNIFSINIGPNYAGKIRDIDVKTLKQVGEMIRAGGSAQRENLSGEK